MLLAKLIEKLDYEVKQGNLSIEITGLTSDSRKVVNHGVFVAIVGANSDGHHYLDSVIEKNAAAVIVQRGSKLPENISDNVTVIVTDNTRLALAYAAAAYYGYPAKQLFTIGITGTKGKSTTTSLMYKILIDQKKDAFLLGNIGEPIFNDIESFTKESIGVIELSSHALEFVKKSTNIGIILDIFEEHLDHYKSLEKYIEAKYNLAKYQKSSDYLIYNFDNEFMKNYNFKYKENDYAVSFSQKPNTKNSVFLENNFIYCNNKKVMDINEKINLKGSHNINNIMFIFAVCDILNLDIEKTVDTIKNFKPLEHRMEFVGNFDGIDYYNNSIATIPEATISDMKAIDNINTIIVGGKDRGVNLHELINALKNNSTIENIICLPKTGEYIRDGLIDSGKNVQFTNELEEAVKLAKQVTKKGMVCLLSPAASSYGYFKNFEERGNLFKKYVSSNN